MISSYLSKYPTLTRAAVVLLVLGLAVALDGLAGMLAQAMHMYPWSAIFLVTPQTMPAS